MSSTCRMHSQRMEPTATMDSQRTRMLKVHATELQTLLKDHAAELQTLLKDHAAELQTLPGLESLSDSLFEGKTLRQLGQGQVDDGMDTCEISAVCYKTKWFYPNWEPLQEIGCIFPAEFLSQLPGLKKIDDMLLFGKSFRRLGDTAKDDNGNSIAGFFLILDMIHALFFNRRGSASTWCRNIKNINKTIAPSLTSIPSGNAFGGTQCVVSYVDALRIIVRYCKMTDVVFDIGNVLVEEESAITNVNDTLAKCEVVSRSVYDQRKLESKCMGEKKKAVCDLHDASAPCVGCKRKISEFGYRQHCIQCYVNMFPATRYETLVRGVIDATFEGFVHNKVMPSCG